MLLSEFIFKNIVCIVIYIDKLFGVTSWKKLILVNSSSVANSHSQTDFDKSSDSLN